MSQQQIMYAVFRQAVYRHECGGIFDNQEDAIAAAQLLQQGEPDAHHYYEVVPFPLNKMLEQAPVRGSFSGGNPKESKPCYTTEGKDL